VPAATTAPTATAAPVETAKPPETKPAEPKPAPKSDAKVVGDKVTIPGQIEFETGSAALKTSDDTTKALDQVKAFLDANPRITKLRIEGHTDNAGSADSNLELSGQRALAVKAAVVAKGAPKERMLAVGCGQTKPAADNSTEEGRAKNRRTEFRIAEVGGKKYMGHDPTGGCKTFGE
jgi:OOP family OmpA-OmpF porin